MEYIQSKLVHKKMIQNIHIYVEMSLRQQIKNPKIKVHYVNMDLSKLDHPLVEDFMKNIKPFDMNVDQCMKEILKFGRQHTKMQFRYDGVTQDNDGWYGSVGLGNNLGVECLRGTREKVLFHLCHSVLSMIIDEI
jgi:hypothetical protein